VNGWSKEKCGKKKISFVVDKCGVKLFKKENYGMKPLRLVRNLGLQDQILHPKDISAIDFTMSHNVKYIYKYFINRLIN
jgi:hypothetical protein